MKKFLTFIILVLFATNFIKAQNLVSYNMSPTADDKYIYYKVKSGDNLTAIAAKYSTTVAVLQTLNTGININTIKIGQTIVVPKINSSTTTTSVKSSDTPVAKTTTSATSPVASSTTTTATTTIQAATSGTVAIYHKVVSGETLYGICNKCGVSVANVKAWNNITDINNITVGKNLIVGYKTSTNSTTSTQSTTAANTTTTQISSTQNSVPTTSSSLPKPTTPDDFSNVTSVTTNADVTTDALVSITEKGIASWTKSSSDDGNYYALHKTAPIGTVITMKNLNNGKSLTVKVIGKLPDTGANQNVIIKISGSAAQNLGILDDKVLVQLTYMGLKPAGK